jgi:hypothetical protein
MEPIFFFIRRTRTQIRILAAESFGPNGTYTPLPRRHPQVQEAAHLLDAFTIAARGKHESQLTAQVLIDGTRPYIMPDTFDRLKAMSKTQIVLRAK